MTIKTLKAMATKVMAAGLLAGAVAMAAPAKAQAEVVVRFGGYPRAYGYGPRYYAPRGYFAPAPVVVVPPHRAWVGPRYYRHW